VRKFCTSSDAAAAAAVDSKADEGVREVHKGAEEVEGGEAKGKMKGGGGGGGEVSGKEDSGLGDVNLRKDGDGGAGVGGEDEGGWGCSGKNSQKSSRDSMCYVKGLWG